MRKQFSFLYLAAMLLLALACSVPAQSNQSQQTDPTVYLSKTGTKYHRESCRTLKATRKPVKLSVAKANGYAACKVCRPPQ
jgi:competence protein ComEC